MSAVRTRFDDEELARTLCDEDESGLWPTLSIVEQDRYRNLAAAARRYFADEVAELITSLEQDEEEDLDGDGDEEEPAA
jgi:hypothetical protein